MYIHIYILSRTLHKMKLRTTVKTNFVSDLYRLQRLDQIGSGYKLICFTVLFIFHWKQKN